MEAAKFAGLKRGTSITRCCQGKHQYAGKHPVTGEKLQWKMADQDETIHFTEKQKELLEFISDEWVSNIEISKAYQTKYNIEISVLSIGQRLKTLINCGYIQKKHMNNMVFYRLSY